MTERQQSSESPPKPLDLVRKSEISLMENTPLFVPYGLYPPLDKRQRGSRLTFNKFQFDTAIGSYIERSPGCS